MYTSRTHGIFKGRETLLYILITSVRVISLTPSFSLQLEFLGHTNTVKVIWRLFSFTGGGGPQVSLREIFQT